MPFCFLPANWQWQTLKQPSASCTDLINSSFTTDFPLKDVYDTIRSVVKVRRNAAELSSGTYHFEQNRVPSPVVGGTQFRQTTTVKHCTHRGPGGAAIDYVRGDDNLKSISASQEIPRRWRISHVAIAATCLPHWQRHWQPHCKFTRPVRLSAWLLGCIIRQRRLFHVNFTMFRCCPFNWQGLLATAWFLRCNWDFHSILKCGTSV